MEWTKKEIRDENGKGFDLYLYEELVMPEFFLHLEPETRLRLIKDLSYKDDDVFVASFPKTGTHWMANLVHFLKTDDPVESTSTVSPNLVDFIPLDMWKRAETTSTISSHMFPNRMPREHVEKGGKVILVVRDPRDAAVSLFHHMIKFEKLNCPDISWARFVEAFLNGDVPFGSHFDYYNTWRKFVEERKQNSIIVFYEDLKENGLKELQRMQKFLGKSHSPERLQQILDKCTVKNMKSAVDSGAVRSPLVDKDGKSILYRKGEVGDWKNYFTVAQSERMNTLIEKKFRDTIFARYQQTK